MVNNDAKGKPENKNGSNQINSFGKHKPHQSHDAITVIK